jgi:hypothetical protein
MANVKIDIAAEFTGNKAFKQAETASQKMERSVAKLGKQLAGVFAASKLYAFGKASVKAFAEDEKAARSLALALANTGNAFAGIEVEKFIGDLQRATGVLDDKLRPAFRTLLTATGDVKKSQDGLALALDIAAGTGKDLSAVSMALAKAYGGQTTALSRLGAGLDKATLKTGDMDVILGQLTDKFKGQALAAAEGYSGSIAKLTVASQNAKEIIGKDLLDSMQMIAGKDGIGGAGTAMEGFATQIGNAIYGIGVLTTKIKSLPGADFIGLFLSAAFQVSGLGALSKFGASSKAASAGTPAQSPGQRKAIDKANADALKLAKTKNSLTAIENNNTKEKLILTAGEKALMELKKIFDLEGIQIQAALNGVLTEEERARVLGLKAIKDSDGALALQALSALNAADATGLFANAARAAALLLQTSYSAGLSSFKQSEINSLTQGPMAVVPPSISQGTPVIPQSPLQSFRQNEAQYAGASGVTIQINPAVAGLIDVIQNQSASGISPTVNRINSSYIA